MITKEGLKNLIKEENERTKTQPIYEIMVFEKPNSEFIGMDGRPFGYPDIGSTNYVGYYLDLDVAYESIISNTCNIHEYAYFGAFLLVRYPGLYQTVDPSYRLYFVYNPEKKEYEQKEEPEFFNHIAY